MVNSREKGKRYERHVASLFKAEGYDARRGQQFCGANGDADVIGVPGIHIECKHNERLNIYDAIDQSERDARPNELPVVFHTKNYCDDIVSMKASRFMRFYHAFYEEFIREETDEHRSD